MSEIATKDWFGRGRGLFFSLKTLLYFILAYPTRFSAIFTGVSIDHVT